MFSLRKLFQTSYIVMLSTVASATVFAQQIVPAPPQLAASAYVLMDAESGAILVEHNADEQLPPASLTKMMTSYIVSEEVEAGRLKEQDLVRISDNAWNKGGSKSGSSTMFLNPRTEVPVIDLLRGVIIQSGNDASIALAEHIAGNEMAFADVMNQQAKLLGMNDTNFVNATGWPAEGHITTARDLAILGQAVVKDHPDHYPIHAEKYFKYNGINQANRNKLLFRDKTVDGLKTGHTNEAGFCLVASAKKRDMRLITVVMGAKSEESRAAESQRLLSYGFRYFSTHNLYQAASSLHTSRVWGGLDKELVLTIAKDVVVTIPRGAHTKLVAETIVDKGIHAPVVVGQELGRLQVTLEGDMIVDVPLIASAAVAESGFFARTWDSLMFMVQGE